MNRYRIEIEIHQGNGGDIQNREGPPPVFNQEGICPWMYRGDGIKSFRTGQRFTYPDDTGRICPWLMDSLNAAIRVLQHGGTLPWTYEGTPYKKEVDPEGITTEYMRCMDPTASGIVVKLIRTRVD
ncbi:MAG: hypothetical protein D3926_21710 [Desulfobacteraceae bacterium]|nr:MAG: hypothetical protein D3926_21710 [Desulfobacteraceae bacterium]